MSKNTVSSTISNFEEFQGLDFKKTPLTRGTNFAREFQNYRNSEGDSVRGIEGFRALAQPGLLGGIHNYARLNRETGATENEVLGVNAFLWKLGKDTLTVTATPSTGTYTTSVSYVYDEGTDSGIFYLNVYSDAVLVTSFLLGTGEVETNGFGDSHHYSNDSSINGWYYTVWELASAIDATGAFSCTYPTESGRFANAMGSTFTTAITMDAGHTLTSQGISSFYSDRSKSLFPFSCSTAVAGNTANVNNGEYAFLEDYTLSSNISINRYFGKGAAPAAGIELRDNGTSGFYIDYYYWEPIRCGYEDAAGDAAAFTYEGLPNRWKHPPFKAFFNTWKDSSTNNSQLPVFKNSHDVCLIGAYCPSNYLKDVNFGYIFKYDGAQIYRLGLPTPAYYIDYSSTKVSIFTIKDAAGNLTGYYKYRVRFKHTDSQENVTYSRYLELAAPVLATENLELFIQGITPLYAGGASLVLQSNTTTTNNTLVTTLGSTVSFDEGDVVSWYNVSNDTINYGVVTGTALGAGFYLSEKISTPSATVFVRIRNAKYSERPEDSLFRDHFGFPSKNIICSGNSMGQVSSLTIPAAALHTFKVGDLVAISDYANPVATLTKYVRLNAVTTTTISWDATKYGKVREVRNVVTSGLVIEVFRTKVLPSATSSGTFYKVWEIPYLQTFNQPALIPDGAGAAYQPLIDDRVDTLLAEEFFDQEFGEEFDLPPRAHLLELHQGTLAAVGTKEPNTVRWSLPGEPSYFPLATRNVDIDSSLSSCVTAIISSDESKLIAFKDRAHYELDGDFTTVGAVSSRIISENDYGVANQSSLIRAKKTILAIGNNGIFSIKDGVVNLDFAENMNPIFQNSSSLNFNRAVAYHNVLNQEVGFFLPGANIAVNAIELKPVNWIIFDYSGSVPRWYTRAFGLAGSVDGLGFMDDTGVMYNPLGGNCIYNNEFLFFNDNSYDSGAWGGQLYRQFPRFTTATNVPTYTPGLYLAQQRPIENRFSPQWEALGNPSLYKMFRRLRIWSFPSELEEKTEFDFTIKGYRNWSTTEKESSAQTMAVADYWKTIHLKTDSKLLSFAFSLVSKDTTGTKAPFISGYQYVALAVSSEEDILL